MTLGNLSATVPTDDKLPVNLDLGRPKRPAVAGKASGVLAVPSPLHLEALFQKEVGDEVSAVFAGDFKIQGKIAQKGIQPETDILAISIQGVDSILHLEKDRPGNYRGSIIHRRSTVAHRISTSQTGALEIEQISYSELICAPAGATPEMAAGLPPNPMPEQDIEFGFDAAPEETIPAFDSYPDATAVIYMDFDGQVVTNTSWNSLKNVSSINASPSNLSSSAIQEVCTRVAEDYVAFNVSVTTSLSRYQNAPPNRRIRVIVTPSSGWYGAAGGVAYLGSFLWTGDTPCWVFENNVGDVKGVAEAASHEAGHTFSLRHDGKQPAGSDTGANGEYFYGVDNASVSWGPIMGAGYRPQFVQWSRGEYSGATNTEDDLAIITSSNNGFGYRNDDKDGTLATAPGLAFQTGSATIITDSGIIEKNTDTDMMRFTCSGGNVNLTVSPNSIGPNLFLKADLIDASGNVLQSRTSSKNSPGVTLSLSVSAGTYYLSVQGVGMTAPVGSTPPYNYDVSGYGSIGRYSISGSVPSANSAPSLAVNTDTVTQSATFGVNPPNQAFSVRNAGGQSLSYTISESIPWLSVAPTGGSSTGSSVSHAISYNTSGLAAGSYSGVITVSAAGVAGSPKTISVHLTVSSASVVPPTGVLASDGTYSDKVRISWNVESEASSYEIYRSNINLFSGAALLGTSGSTAYDDASALPGVTYFYWVKAVKSGLISGFSDYDSGFRGVLAGNNDAFANRASLTGSTASVTASNRQASKEAGEPSHGGNSGGRSLWWNWTAPANGTLTVNTIGSDFDTTLGVYTGTSVSSLATGGNDDDSGGSLTSLVQLQVTAGTSYAIAVDGYNGSSGTIRLNLSFVASAQPPSPPQAVAATDGTLADRVRVTWSAGAGAASYDVHRNASPQFSSSTLLGNVSGLSFDDTTAAAGTTYHYWVVARNSAGTSTAAGPDSGFRSQGGGNDAFANRAPLTGSFATVTADSRQATKETGEPSHGGNSGGRSLWWSWTAPANGTLTVDTAGSDFDTTLGVYTGSSVSGLTTQGSNDDFGGNLTSRVQVQVTAGTSYAIAVDGYNGSSGAIRLNLSFAASAQPPSPPTAVAATDGILPDRVRVTWSAGAGAASYDVHRNASPQFSSSTLLGNVSGLSFDDTTAAAGTTYHYWVVARNSAGTSTAAGPDSGFRSQAVSNDAFANRAPLTGSSATVTADSRQATKETGEPSHGGNSGGRSLWWSWTAPANGTLTVDTAGSDFDTTLGVYTGSSVSGLTTRGSNDDFGGNTTSLVQVQVTAGTSYAISVDGYNGAAGTVGLQLAFMPLPRLDGYRVGNQVLLDLNGFLAPGESIRLSGKLPAGLRFSALTGVISGIVTGKPGTYAIAMQVLRGGVVVRTLDLPITVLPFPSSLLGSYEAILKDAASVPIGKFRITITKPNAWSATLETRETARRSAKGGFILAEGEPLVPISVVFSASGTAPAITVSLTLDGNSPSFGGSHSGAIQGSGTLVGFRLADRNQTPSSSIRLNLAFGTESEPDPQVPAGVGWLSGAINTSGIGAFKGILGDGTPATVSLALSQTGQAALWVQPYSNKDSFVGGILELANVGRNFHQQTVENEIWWRKAPDSRTLSYPAGFDAMQLLPLASPWSPPASAVSMATFYGWQNGRRAKVIMLGAGISNDEPQTTPYPLPTEFVIDDRFNLTAIAPASGNRVAWSGKIAPATGALSGALTIPPGFSSVTIAGKAAVSGVCLRPGDWPEISACGLIKLPVPGPKGSYRTAAIVLGP